MSFYVPKMLKLLELVHYDPRRPDSKIELGARLVCTALLDRVAEAMNVHVFQVTPEDAKTLTPGFYWQDRDFQSGPYQTKYDCLDAATTGLLEEHTIPEEGDCVTHVPTGRKGTVRLTRPGFSFVDFGEAAMPFTWVVNGDLEPREWFDSGYPQSKGYVNQD